MRLAIDEVRPHEHHSGAGCRREQDEAGDVAVHLIRRQPGPEEMRDEDPGQQRHRERLDEPIDADGGGDAAPVLTDLAQGGEIDLEQHRHNHEPHQHRDRQIDLRHRRITDDAKDTRQQLAERDADDDAERHPKGEEAFEHTHGWLARRRAAGRGNRFTHDGDPLFSESGQARPIGRAVGYLCRYPDSVMGLAGIALR